MRCKKHKWASLVAHFKNQNTNTSLFVCLGCGQLKIGRKTIRISKYRMDLGGAPIKNAGPIYATELHGTVYYGHIYFREKRCFVCKKIFQKREKVVLMVVEKGKKGIGLLPCHLNCVKEYGF